MIRCTVIDDEQPAIDVITRLIAKVPGLEVISTSTDPIEGIKTAIDNSTDILFLDIEMDGLSGFDLLNIIPPQMGVVLVTAFSKYAVRSYDFKVLDYLLKPVDLPRFLLTAKRIAEFVKPPVNDFIMVKADQKGKLIKIELSEIDFIESRSNYVAFFCGKEIIQTYITMQELESRLPKDRFMRVHRSYIISLYQIAAVENGDCILKRNTFRVPVSAHYKDELWHFLRNRLIA
ncbi:LytR/AlgR family response regulator transcription factor [Mucilaginibacter defluvii]|uniref:LytTR family DNA-binding domain-containing protein n=1 Tax=Mucilaginibacter defluvii TaxID=1196019 RepID=A0ABP9FK42_9SPHI